MRRRRILFIIIITLTSSITCFPQTGNDTIPLLYRYYLTDRKGKDFAYFEFDYDETLPGFDRQNRVHQNKLFILFDIAPFWNAYMEGDFCLGDYEEKKPLFDALHFAPYAVKSTAFYEISGEEDLFILQYDMAYSDIPVPGGPAITKFTTDIKGSDTYHHWPGGYLAYDITYPEPFKEIHINIINAMGGADFGPYYIGILDNTRFLSSLYSVEKQKDTGEFIDTAKRTRERDYSFDAKGRLTGISYYERGRISLVKNYIYNARGLPVAVIPENKERGKLLYEYNDQNQLIRIYADDREINTCYYDSEGLLRRDSYGRYEWNVNKGKHITRENRVKAVSIMATSYINWRDMYIPDLLFDNDPETGWLEDEEDSGIGEKIILELTSEITVDKIKFMPGYFHPEWWESNNRVKKLTIAFKDAQYTVVFKDVMKPQSFTLPEPATFQTITFTIADVYHSNKDNDTGMSEIEFYYKGEKIFIDAPDPE
jgi:hypothetical protein